ncbi:dual specificity protein kinase splB-like [Plodia interpunctella]|uniref:dual specificity protein kinase splB-like n=1 Tax=Plodia interpunctella TaxID=58824 RepID=UPI002368D98F|nr:dual specificity protein kinase splB-like [Plodia interpunctella]
MFKMREILRILFVVWFAFLLVVRCDNVDVPDSPEEARNEEVERIVKPSILSGVRRASPASNTSTARDSHLLSVLAARRKQLKSGHAAILSALPALAQAARKGNTTFAKIEIRDANNVTVKRLTFEATPPNKLYSADKDRQDVRPHIFVPKSFQENRSRLAFDNKRRDHLNANKNTPDRMTDSSVVYVPPEKLEGLDKEVELDPEEEFQVDESNHGLYLLNYSDTENVTQSPVLNKTTTTIVNDIKQNTTVKIESTTLPMNTTNPNITEELQKEKEQQKESNEDKSETNTIANSTDSKSTQLVNIENEKEKENNTVFMSDEIINHFRHLESELTVEEMAPFIYFGQKLGGQVSDNLTNSPSLSASTKSVNFIAAPLEKRKFNSRYSATEKYKNTSVDEEEVNEEMDVSVVKNTIEKNKIRNTVKGPAPARHVGLVNAYRKYSSSTPATTKSPTIAQLNVTEQIIFNVTPITVDKNKENNQTNVTSTNKESLNITNKTNSTTTVKDNPYKFNITSVPRNYTRSYFNLRRRPTRVTASSTAENIVPTLVNTTTEKTSTSVYTAVVTSVSITSSMKAKNITDGLDVDNSTIPEVKEYELNSTIPKAILLNETETSTVTSSTYRPYKHRIRIRTTTTESSMNSNPSSSPIVLQPSNPPTSEMPTTSRISERLASLLRQNVYETLANGSTVRPKNILRRRRPTTTSTTSTTTTPEPPSSFYISSESPITLPTQGTSSNIPPVTTEAIHSDVTQSVSTFKPFVVTSKTSSQSKSKPVLVATSAPSTNISESNNTSANVTKDSEEEGTVTKNEEVVIEAEKNYTASYVLAGLGFLPVGAIIAFVLRNVLNKKTKEIDTEYEGYFDDGEIKKESPITPVARPPMPPPTKPDQKWEFPRNKLRLQTLLGQGNFGQVWKAEADDLNGHDGLTRLVAVKTIKETASQKEKQELLHEIYIMQKIGTHPNVVTILACCTEQEPYLLIMEYVMCGKLLTYLRERRSRPDRFSGSGALTSRDLTVFAYCVARGMDYIASKGIVHRDLAARNVLVDHNKLCKIADFGMSRAAGAAARAARSALPVRWMAPEALLYNVYSHHTDVWAFGILLWEIVTLGSTPYAAMSGREVLSAVTEGYRLERPAHCKPQLYRAMHACWHADPSQRPSFAALKAQLAELLDNEPSEGNYVDLDSFYQESSVYSDPSAIINDDEGLSAEYDRERRCFRDLGNKGGSQFESRPFAFSKPAGAPRRALFSDGEFNDRAFSDNSFPDKTFPDTNFAERKDGKLSTSSFHRERERENPLVSRNSFNGFPRIGTRDGHFQLIPDGRNNRVSEFECDI